MWFRPGDHPTTGTAVSGAVPVFCQLCRGLHYVVSDIANTKAHSDRVGMLAGSLGV